MKGVALQEDEFIIASLVADEPGELCRHGNQVAAVTNKRLLFIRYTGMAIAFEDRYTIESIDLRRVSRVRQRTRFTLLGPLAGLLSVGVGILAALCVVAYEIMIPIAVFISLTLMSGGAKTIIQFKRRVLVFEAVAGNHKWKWVSGSLAYRKTEGIATEIQDQLAARSPDEVYGFGDAMLAECVPMPISDNVSVYHWVFLVMAPYIAFPWGIVNLIRGKKRSGKLMCFGSILWAILFVVIVTSWDL